MAEHKSVYLWSLQEAQKLNEVELWRESYKENCTCARAIEQCIDDNDPNNKLPLEKLFSKGSLCFF